MIIIHHLTNLPMSQQQREARRRLRQKRSRSPVILFTRDDISEPIINYCKSFRSQNRKLFFIGVLFGIIILGGFLMRYVTVFNES